MSTQHTPGPWSYSHPAEHVWKIRDADGSLLADYHGANSDDNPQNEANARLIAAAPDLLAALQSLLDMYLEGANSGDWGFWNPEEESEVIAARAAIQKAGQR